MRGERTQPGNEFNNAQSILDIIRKFDVVRFGKNVCELSNDIKNPSKTIKVSISSINQFSGNFRDSQGHLLTLICILSRILINF